MKQNAQIDFRKLRIRLKKGNRETSFFCDLAFMAFNSGWGALAGGGWGCGDIGGQPRRTALHIISISLQNSFGLIALKRLASGRLPRELDS